MRKVISVRHVIFFALMAYLLSIAASHAQEDWAVSINAFGEIFCERDFVQRFANGIIFSSDKEIYLKDVWKFPGDFVVLSLYSMGIVKKFGICNHKPWEVISHVVNVAVWTLVFIQIKAWLKSG